MPVNFKDPKVIKITVGLIVMLIITISWYTTSFKKNAAEIKAKSDDLERLRVELVEAKRNAAQFSTIKAECQRIFEQYKALESLMPPQRDDPEFLNKIYSSAKNTGVFIRSINLLASTKTDFYISNPYEVQLSGTFSSLGSFLADMVNYSVLTTFSNLQVAAKREGVFSLNSSMTITTYSIPQEEILQPPEALKLEPPPFVPPKYEKGKK
jgi:Tfp pilus assembly protein PilO